MKVLINGAAGRMGKELTAKVKNGYLGSELTALVDSRLIADGDKQFRKLDDFDGKTDVIIDFSNHAATQELCAYAVGRNIPLVVATTGHTEEELSILKEASKTIPLFYSGNMSLGIALMCESVKKFAQVMKDADIEIVETHHVNKLDAPSGTALMLANAAKSVRPDAFIKSGRSGLSARGKNEIGIQSVRMGNIVGIHEVHICTDSQCITLKHEAFNRALFAEGSLAAANYVRRMEPGFYNMQTMLSEKQ